MTPDCRSGVRGFESHHVRARVAQLGERLAYTQRVAGSSPASRTRMPRKKKSGPKKPTKKRGVRCPTKYCRHDATWELVPREGSGKKHLACDQHLGQRCREIVTETGTRYDIRLLS